MDEKGYIDMTIKMVAEMTSDALTRELIKNKMIKLEPTAIERTQGDITLFKEIVDAIKNNRLPEKMKFFSINHMKAMKFALNRLKNIMSEKDFYIFYDYCINSQSRVSVSENYEVDVSTVSRITWRAIYNLSIFLYPELCLEEIMN